MGRFAAGSLAFLILVGCASTTPSGDRVPLPPDLVEECPPLRPLTGNTGRDLLNKLIEVGEDYNDCASRHKRLVEAIK